MSRLTLPSSRVGWFNHPQRRVSSETEEWMDAKRAIHSVLERLLPSRGPRLPRAVEQALREAHADLVLADGIAFARALFELRADLQGPRNSHTIAGRALAVVGAASTRALGKTPYANQYLAASLILQGRLVEMATGEGKTLAAAMAAAVAALSQVPVHVLTANDYLVKRDSENLAPLFAALGLSLGRVLSGMTHQERAAAYRCDITFVTAKELVFDYLKDHLAQGGERDTRVLRARALQVQSGDRDGFDPDGVTSLLPGLRMAIVDEADACLLDEAVMPLILAKPGRPVNSDEYAYGFAITGKLQRGRHYRLVPARREALLTDAGRFLVNQCVSNLAAGSTASALAPPQRAHELVEAALAARWLYKRHREYTVTACGVQLIDEVTGRISEGRQWSSALQQMVELKEGVELKAPATPAAQITFQRFFPRYLHLCGMSGTLAEARRELRQLYGLGVVQIPLKFSCQRLWQGEVMYTTAEAKWKAVVKAVATQNAIGRPVLVGTDSVIDSVHLSELLQKAGILHRVLSAVQDEHEAECIAQAGCSGAVTVTTNMAGRGTDIWLDPKATAAGGLHVIACMRNRSRRIDRQLLGRCARHGDPGSAQRFVALDDPLLLRGVPRWLRLGASAFACGDRVPGPWAKLLIALGQRSAEWQETRHRKQLRCAERQMSDLYGFSGTTE